MDGGCADPLNPLPIDPWCGHPTQTTPPPTPPKKFSQVRKKFKKNLSKKEKRSVISPPPVQASPNSAAFGPFRRVGKCPRNCNLSHPRHGQITVLTHTEPKMGFRVGITAQNGRKWAMVRRMLGLPRWGQMHARGPKPGSVVCVCAILTGGNHRKCQKVL